jgi:hypothetical protein
MIYGEYGNDLVLKQDVGIDFTKNKAFITRIGRGFNQLLGQGQHQDEWLEVSNPEE